MVKKILAFALATAVAFTMSPIATVNAIEKSDSGDSNMENVKNQVIVLYEEGEVTTDAPKTAKEKSLAKNASTSDDFGSSMAATSIGERGAKNTLDDQASILSESVKDYTIEDTLVFDGVKKSDEDQIISVVSSDKLSTEEMIEKLEKNDSVKIVEPNRIVKVASIDTNDTYKDSAWHLGSDGINVSDGWKAYESSGKHDEQVVIGVIDTGVNYKHEDLASRMWNAPKNFKLQGQYGYDFVDKDTDPIDENGHGSHCAGIAAAQADNGSGILGVAGKADNVKIMALRVLGKDGSGKMADILAAIVYAADASKLGVNIKALNLSIGGLGGSKIVDETCDRAGKEGILTVIAAGNSAVDTDTIPSNPNNTISEYAISVAAADEYGQLASFSNYGMKNVDIAAPGTNILSTVDKPVYRPVILDENSLSKNTAYYSEFMDAEIVTDEEGIQNVIPTAGDDYDGKTITSVESFGQSKQFNIKSEDSLGTTTLSIDSSQNGNFQTVKNPSSLLWKVENAKAGDRYMLIFPYDKEKGTDDDTLSSSAKKMYSTGTGNLMCGDILVKEDEDGDFFYEMTTKKDGEPAESYTFSERGRSIWRTGANKSTLMSDEYIEAQKEDGYDLTYGYGFLISAETYGDFLVEINSIAVAKVGASENDFLEYDIYSGTSMATPVVTGGAALIAAMNPNISPKDLKSTLLKTSRSGFKNQISTEGELDFSKYDGESESQNLKKPTIERTKVDFNGKTVTLEGLDLGSKPTVKVRNNTKFHKEGKDESVTIDPSDINISKGTDGRQVLKIADKYNLIGSDIQFTIDNGVKSGTYSEYLISGETEYNYEFTIDKNKETNAVVPTLFQAGNKLLGMNTNSGDIYEMKKGKFLLLGQSLRDGISEYANNEATSDRDKGWLWENRNGDDYNIDVDSMPTYIDGAIYEFVTVDFGYKTARLLCGMSTLDKKPKWKVYADSLTEHGNFPVDSKGDILQASELRLGSIIGYKGKMYLLASKGSFFEGSITGNEIKWNQLDSLPKELNDAQLIYKDNKIYSFFGVDSQTEEIVNYDVFTFDGSKWTRVGTAPYAVSEFNHKALGWYALFASGATGVKPVMAADKDGIIFAGISFDGLGDTFRYNTKTNKYETLKYSFWGKASDELVTGAAVGNKLYINRISDVQNKAYYYSIPINNALVEIGLTKSGKGSGYVSGVGSVTKDLKNTIEVTPDKGSYIYSISSKGIKFKRSYKKPTAASEKTQSYTFTAKKSGSLKVVFGKKVSSVKMNKEMASVKRGGKLTLKASTDGTNQKVTWKSSNNKIATVNSSGKVKVKKNAKIGESVKITAVSKENKNVKGISVVTVK